MTGHRPAVFVAQPQQTRTVPCVHSTNAQTCTEGPLSARQVSPLPLPTHSCSAPRELSAPPSPLPPQAAPGRQAHLDRRLTTHSSLHHTVHVPARHPPPTSAQRPQRRGPCVIHRPVWTHLGVIPNHHPPRGELLGTVTHLSLPSFLICILGTTTPPTWGLSHRWNEHCPQTGTPALNRQLVPGLASQLAEALSRDSQTRAALVILVPKATSSFRRTMQTIQRHKPRSLTPRDPELLAVRITRHYMG